MGSNNSKSGLERFAEMKTSLTNTLLRQTPEPPVHDDPPPSSSEDAVPEAAADTEQVTMTFLKLA